MIKLNAVQNPNGPKLVYSEQSGIKIIEVDGKYFKNHSKSGNLKPYEDWRLSPKERAKDLSERLSVKDIAGLMLFTSHLSVPSVGGRSQLYNGEKFEESNANPWDLTDIQNVYFRENLIKHTLVTTVQSPSVVAKWNNEVQHLSESMEWGIPVVNSSDPRHSVNSDTEFNEGSGGKISSWPEQLGLGATFDPELVKEFGLIASDEYRHMGMTLTLSPQADLATEPRWMRLVGSFTEDPKLASDMVRAYVDGFQTTVENRGWGNNSVNTMVKHWPGGGSCESGRDAHFGYGKYAVYPGENFDQHLLPFTEGAFELEDGTKKSSSVMPYYSISYDQDKLNKENVGNAYSKYLIDDLLRTKYNYDEVVCTDWCITGDEPTFVLDLLSGDQCWGVEEGYTVAQRHYKLILAGVDQFGGNKDPQPIIEAYDMMVEDYGEKVAEKRFRKSAERILLNIFRVGLFENPYVDPNKAETNVGKAEYIKAGQEAQKKSIVMIKNKNNLLPLKEKKKIYIPKRRFPERIGWYLDKIPSYEDYNLNLETINEAFEIVDSPEKADLAIVKIKSPEKAFDRYNGYDTVDKKNGGNGFVPISLQYRPYVANYSRSKSIAGDPRKKDVLNRTYIGKRINTLNESDLDLVMDVKKQMKDKPVIVIVSTSNPFIMSEWEKQADCILLEFGVTTEALVSIISGKFEPSGLLPVQMPKDMLTIEKQKEDTPFDLDVYVDSEGNAYDYAFGLNYIGVIKDHRTEKYKRK